MKDCPGFPYMVLDVQKARGRDDIRDLSQLRQRRQWERQKRIGLMSKTANLYVHHAFLYISLQSLHNCDVK